MAIVALVVSIFSALGSIGSVWYARRSIRSAEVSATASAQSAAAAAQTAKLDLQRRQAELRPELVLTVERSGSGTERIRLTVRLHGPLDLQRLDQLVVSIRDDRVGRSQLTSHKTTPEQIAEQIWGPYRFVPHTGPHADPTHGRPGADETGRTTPTSGMPVGEDLLFDLEPTTAPSWSTEMTRAQWQQQCGTLLRLLFKCHREGWEPWIVPAEVDVPRRATISIAKGQIPRGPSR